MEYDIDDDDDELFEDANEDLPAENGEVDGDEDLPTENGEMDGDDDEDGAVEDEGGDDDDDGDADDADADADADDDVDADAAGEDHGEDEGDQTAIEDTVMEDRTLPETQPAVPLSRPSPTPILTGSFKQAHPLRCEDKYLNCSNYDITPTVAIPHNCGIYSMATSWGLKWLFTGGQDGFIRKYNFADSVNGKTPLTVAQKHSLVDSIVNAGVLASYWENEQPLLEKEARARAGHDGQYEPKVSPVYSLAVQSEAVWLLAGLESGGITLQTVRHGEGQIQAYLNKHKSAVSAIKLDDEETRALTGSWDRTVVEWDLDTGNYIHQFDGLSGQVSSLEWQPEGGSYIRVPQAKQENGNKASNQDSKNTINGKNNDDDGDADVDDDDEDDKKSMESLFGDDDDESNSNSRASPQLDIKAEAENSEDAGPGPIPVHSHSVFMTSCIDGTIDIWDRRTHTKSAHTAAVKQLTPPWCASACWSADGSFIFAGRRNGTVDEYDVRNFGTPSRVLKFPSVSGAVSAVCALPSGHHVLCGSQDNVRLYDLNAKSSKTPFYIIPGHHGGVLSSIYVDPTCSYLITSSGSRGWQGTSTDVTIIYEIDSLA